MALGRCSIISLSFGSHLWNLEKAFIAKAVDTIYRKGIRRGLGSCWRESLSERLGNWLVSASVKIYALQGISLKRALDSRNSLVAGVSDLGQSIELIRPLRLFIIITSLFR